MSLSYLTPPPTVPATRHSSITRSDPPIIDPALIESSVHVDPARTTDSNHVTVQQPPERPLHPYGYSKQSFPRAAPCSLPPFAALNHTLFPSPTHGNIAPSYSNANKTPPATSVSSPHPHGPPLYSRPVKTNRDELDQSPAPGSPNPRADKRRKTRKVASTASGGERDSPSIGSNGGGGPGESPDGDAEFNAGQQKRMSGGLAPIKPIGFAASRENRRESGGMGGESGLPSPVVMGFDFQKVDDDQLKTVRDTISIKSQQEALIAQRRRDLAASTPNTPKELTFKGWQPKEPVAPATAAPLPGSASGSVGKRRDKTRDKVERMSINTAGGDKEGAPGSKSAPLNQNLSAQQSERGEPVSGSQTSMPSGHHPNGQIDPRTAPMSNVRGSRADDGELTRQQGAPVTGQYYRRYEPGHSHNRSVTEGGPRSSARIVTSSSRGYDDRMPPPSAGGGQRNGYGQGGQQGGGGGHGHTGPSGNYTSQDQDRSSASPSPPPPPHRREPPPTASHAPQMSARREAFLAPYNQLYDLLHQAEGLRYNLQDLMHRYEGLYAGQQVAMQEFKGTAASSNTLLGNLQQSAESLKEMVRYEVGKIVTANAGGSGEGNKQEVDELKERIKKLEERLDKEK